MSNWLFALRLIPLITSLVSVAEKLLGAKEGIKKKEFVKDGIRQIVKAMLVVTTGGAQATWQAVDSYMESISGLIDIIVALMFPND
ncbi:hypothetical protein KA005_39575 [bacterium]|nr:hypothetical protein [bacterium]